MKRAERDLRLTPTSGLATGNVIQFADGSWAQLRTLGEGVAMSEEAFDLVEPILQLAWPDWSHDLRYGVSELPAGARPALVAALRREAEVSAEREDGRSLLRGLADWLDNRQGQQRAVSILGL